MHLLVQVSLHETHGVENGACHESQEQISLRTPDSAISLNYTWKTETSHIMCADLPPPTMERVALTPRSEPCLPRS